MPVSQRRLGQWVDLASGIGSGTPTPSSFSGVTVITANPAVTGRDTLVLGDYRPDGSTTGVIPGTPMTITSSHSPVSGTISSPTLYTGLDIRNSVDFFNKGNIVYRSCIFRGKADPLSGGAQGLASLIRPNLGNISFIDCEFIPQRPDFRWVGVHGCYGATILRCKFSLLVDAMQVFTTGSGAVLNSPCKTIIRQNYIFDHAFFPPGGGGGESSSNGSHSDGIQWQGGPGLIVEGNYFTGKLAPQYVPGLSPPANNVNANSCMQIKPDVGLIAGGTIRKNWFGGGGVPINIADDSPARWIDDLGSIIDNRFYRDNTFYPTMIQIGSVAVAGTPGHTSIAGTYTGNVFDDNDAPVNIRRTQA